MLVHWPCPGVAIKYQFQYLHLSRATSPSWLGLTFRYRSIVKPSCSGHCTSTNVGAHSESWTMNLDNGLFLEDNGLMLEWGQPITKRLDISTHKESDRTVVSLGRHT